MDKSCFGACEMMEMLVASAISLNSQVTFLNEEIPRRAKNLFGKRLLVGGTSYPASRSQDMSKNVFFLNVVKRLTQLNK
ncbi:Hypothetical protein FKW44_024836, partial [Caligus rogercresseyi]